MQTIEDLSKHYTALLLSQRTKTACIDTWAKCLAHLKAHKTATGQTPSANTIRRVVGMVRKQIKASAKGTIMSGKLQRWLLSDRIESNGSFSNLGVVVAGKDIAKISDTAKEKALLNSVKNKARAENINALISNATTWLNSACWKRKTVAIALLTGRRTIEVLRESTMQRNTPNTLKITGFAKKKTDTDTAIVPVLASPAMIIKALKELRKEAPIQSLSNEDINKKYQNAFNRLVAELTKEHIAGKATMHDLRKVYASYCLKHFMGKGIIKDEYGNDTNNERVFLRLILGHDNNSTGIYYETFEV